MANDKKDNTGLAAALQITGATSRSMQSSSRSGGTESQAGGVATGALQGAGTGAAIGSTVPGIGTAYGAAAGAAIGGLSGLLSARAASEARRRKAKAEGLQNLIVIKQKEEQQRQNAFAGLQAAFAKALS